jgi:hypothetical protein
MNWQHCTKDTHRKTTNAAWPLKNAAGLTFAKAMEARRAATGTGAVHDSAVPQAFARKAAA